LAKERDKQILSGYCDASRGTIDGRKRNKRVVDRRPGGSVEFANSVFGSVRDCNEQVPSGHCDVPKERPRRNEGPVDPCPSGGIVFANRVGVVHDKKKSSDDCDAGDAVVARARRNVELVDHCTGGVVYANSAGTVRNKQFPSGQGDVSRVMQPRNEGAVDCFPGGGVVQANCIIGIVRDIEFVSGQRHASRETESRRNEGAVDRCPGSGIIFANRAVALVRDKNLGATGYGYQAKRGNYEGKKKCSHGLRMRPRIEFVSVFIG